MGQLTLPATGAVYLDADAIIYAIEKIDPYAALLLPLFEAIGRRTLGLVGSELLLVETLVKPLAEGDADLEAAFRQFLTASREMAFIPVSRAVLERALELSVAHRIRTPDAIHAATALLAGCTLFVTNDPAFRRIDGLPVTVLDDLLQIPRLAELPSESVIDDFDLPEKLRTACWLMVDRVHWLVAQRGAAEEWRIEVAVGGAVAHAHIEISAFEQGDEEVRG